MADVIPFKKPAPAPAPLKKGRRNAKVLSFDREEFSRLIALYSAQVAGGNWRDYAVDFLPGQALFSVYRHAHEAPVMTISKQVRPSGKDREFVLYAGPKRLARGDDLAAITSHINQAVRLHRV